MITLPVSALPRRFIAVLLAITGISLATGCGGGGDGSTDNATRGEKIVFVSEEEGFRGINLINPDGTGRVRLTNDDAKIYNSGARFSPDGRKILFLSNRENCGGVGCQYGATQPLPNPRYPLQLWTMNSDGTDLRRITRNTEGSTISPQFTADSSRIGYISYREGRYAIQTMRMDGSDPVDVYRVEAVRFPDFAYSADGSKFVFSRTTNFYPRPNDEHDALYTANADGTEATRIPLPMGTKQLDGPKNYSRPGLTYNLSDLLVGYMPSLSPDGKRVLYCLYQSDEIGPNGEVSNAQSEIYVMNVDGTGQTRLTNNKFQDLSPGFSPDGSQIMFTQSEQTVFGDAPPAPSRVCIINADGTNFRYLTPRPAGSPFTDTVSPGAWVAR